MLLIFSKSHLIMPFRKLSENFPKCYIAILYINNFLNENKDFYHCGYCMKKCKLVKETSKLKKVHTRKTEEVLQKTTLLAGNKKKAASVCSLSLISIVLRIFGNLLHFCVSFSNKKIMLWYTTGRSKAWRAVLIQMQWELDISHLVSSLKVSSTGNVVFQFKNWCLFSRR